MGWFWLNSITDEKKVFHSLHFFHSFHFVPVGQTNAPQEGMVLVKLYCNEKKVLRLLLFPFKDFPSF
jgi:hypothetical protein